MRPYRWLTTACLLALASCDRPQQDRPLAVSVIGEAPRIVDPNLAPLDAADAALLGATAEGLVRFDQTGQIEPGLAERWIVYDEGRSFIFRLRADAWPDGKPITASEVARSLRAMAARRSGNPLRPLLGAIDEISAVTPQVVEVELHSPRPYLLHILAQPEAAVLHGDGGGGPMSVVARRDGAVRLRPRPAPDAEPGDKADADHDVLLRGGRAALGIVRFVRGEADAMLGGTFLDLPLVRAAEFPPAALRFDPVQGLFGLAFSNEGSAFVADAANRRALASAVDRDAIRAALGVPGWATATGIVATPRPDLQQPATPDWSAQTLDERRPAATAIVAAWAKTAGHPPVVRVAMPEGTGGRLLFALLARSWRSIGVSVEAVPLDAKEADLRLIDRVAPAESANFYLRRFACEEGVPCTPEGEAALDASRAAPTLAERSAAFAEADRLLTETVPYIAFGAPIRWSLVSEAAAGWRPSRGIHPLATLRGSAR